jgi:hypothetical protein
VVVGSPAACLARWGLSLYLRGQSTWSERVALEEPGTKEDGALGEPETLAKGVGLATCQEPDGAMGIAWAWSPGTTKDDWGLEGPEREELLGSTWAENLGTAKDSRDSESPVRGEAAKEAVESLWAKGPGAGTDSWGSESPEKEKAEVSAATGTTRVGNPGIAEGGWESEGPANGATPIVVG